MNHSLELIKESRCEFSYFFYENLPDSINRKIDRFKWTNVSKKQAIWQNQIANISNVLAQRPVYSKAAPLSGAANHSVLPVHEKINFRLTNISEKDRKDHIFVSFLMFPFHGNIIFS